MDVSDVPSVLCLHHESKLSAWSLEDYLNEIEEKNSICLVAKIEEKLAGFIVVRLILSETYAELLNIAVSEEFKRKKIGQILMNRIMESCQKSGLNSILLEVRVSNNAALQFYKKNHFEVLAERKNFYSNPSENAYTMRRTFK
jgi:ribosomal-protein-alanine N-acetyltransferase